MRDIGIVAVPIFDFGSDDVIICVVENAALVGIRDQAGFGGLADIAGPGDLDDLVELVDNESRAHTSATRGREGIALGIVSELGANLCRRTRTPVAAGMSTVGNDLAQIAAGRGV